MLIATADHQIIYDHERVQENVAWPALRRNQVGICPGAELFGLSLHEGSGAHSAYEEARGRVSRRVGLT